MLGADFLFFLLSAYRCGFCGSVFCLNEVCVWGGGRWGSLRSGVWRLGVERGGCTFECWAQIFFFF